MSEVQKIDYAVLTKKGLTMRPETGPMQFGDDWPGLFIRGDEALGFARILRLIAPGLHDNETAWIERFAKLLASCEVRNLEAV